MGKDVCMYVVGGGVQLNGVAGCIITRCHYDQHEFIFNTCINKYNYTFEL